MKSARKSILGRGVALAIFATCFFSAPSHSPVSLAGSDGPSPSRPRSCEQRLADCMNAGGDSNACWNAYWRCSSR